MNPDTPEVSDTSYAHSKVLLRPGIVYAFNVAPCDSYQYCEKPPKTTEERCGDENRLSKFRKHWDRFFTEFKLNDISVHLFCELSEPVYEKSANQSSRLHYHGYIYFEDVPALKWFLLYGTVLLSRSCRYTVGAISDSNKWYSYITKQSFLGLPSITSPMQIDEYRKLASKQ